jgi:four helix bundle protein
MHKFKELFIWQKGRILVKEIYLVTSSFPKDELFGLTNQLRRCSVSIPANIAEGCGRGTDKELCRFIDIANGSATELETLIILSFDLNYIDDSTFKRINNLILEVQKMLYKFKVVKKN